MKIDLFLLIYKTSSVRCNIVGSEKYKETDLSECDIQFNIKTNIESVETLQWFILKETTREKLLMVYKNKTLLSMYQKQWLQEEVIFIS